MQTPFMNDETGPNESQMTSNEGHQKHGWRIESLEHSNTECLNSKGLAPNHSLPYDVTTCNLVSAKQCQLSY